MICDETFDLPSDFLVKPFIPLRTRKLATYWGIDEAGAFYVIRNSLPAGSKDAKQVISEAFVCVPMGGKSDKCAVYFFSDFNYYHSDDKKKSAHPLLLNPIVHDHIKVARMSVLSSFIEHQKRVSERKFKELYKLASKVEQEVAYVSPDMLH